MASNEQWTTVIKPKNGWFDLHLKEVYGYKDLIFLFVRRNFVSLYKQTILGPAWAIIQPLLTTVVFTIVFGNIANLGTDGAPQFVFYMCGNIAWSYFSTFFTSTATTFVSNSAIYGKVYFPRLVIPISTVLTNLISFGIQMALFLCFWAYYLIKGAIAPTIWMLAIPLLIVQMALLGLGFGIIVSALTTKYRDLTMLVSFGVQLWMYATPIAYPLSMINEKFGDSIWSKIYMLNPMTPVIELFRNAFLGTGSVNVSYLLIGFAATLVVLFLGIILFSRVEKTFMDTV